MDPADPTTFHHRTELLSTGRRYHFVDQCPPTYNPATTTTILCIHGFPDIWYAWRHQIKAWVEMGYRVVVPDKLGYGGSDKPEDASHYTPKRISTDLAALLDLLQIAKAVVVGHDWGSFMASRFAMWHPDRLLALVLLSVPFIPPMDEYHSLEQLVEAFPNWGYQLYFQDKSNNAELEKNLAQFLRLVFRVQGDKATHPSKSKWVLPGGLKRFFESGPVITDTGILEPHELDYHLSQFREGVNGPLNYYRTTRHRFDEEQDDHMLRAPRSNLPVLLMVGKNDPTTNKDSLHLTVKHVPQARIEVIDGVGHWMMLEARDHISNSIPKFLREALALEDGVQTKL